MRKDSQSSLSGPVQSPGLRRTCMPRRLSRAVAVLLCAVLLLLAPVEAFAGPVRVGGLEVQPTANLTLGYDSNVDGAYPEDETPNYRKDDFYVKPGVTLRFAPIRLPPSTTVTLNGSWAYEDYFKRNDLDTDVYNLSAGFDTVMTYLTLNGSFVASRQTDHSQDETYYPGGTSRDPNNTIDAAINANFALRKFRFTASQTYSREVHDLKEYKEGNQQEWSTTLSAYYDFLTWASFFYSWNRDETELLEVDEDNTVDTTEDFGISGVIPTSILRRPAVTWSIGGTREKSNTDTEDPRWEFTYNLGVSDTIQLDKCLTLSYNVSWDSEDNKDEDEVGFTYGINLTHLWGPHITQTFGYTREPVDTFGSTTDTDTTTFSYALSIANFFLKGLSAGYSISYEISDPLEGDSPTEYTTTQSVNLSHSRVLSKHLSRTISYVYQWENTNAHHDGPMQEHTIEYLLNYVF